MANPEHVAMLKRSVEEWNRWREEEWKKRFDPSTRAMADERPDLSEADLSGANLTRALLANTDFVGANLTKATFALARCYKANFAAARLKGASFIAADLQSVNFADTDLGEIYFSCSNLTDAIFSGAQLSRAKFSHANLTRTNLEGADLRGAEFLDAVLNSALLGRANLRGAMFGRTVVADVDLGDAEGLEGVLHAGRSSIGIDTICRSRPGISESFLRGAGVPDSVLGQIPTFVGSPESIQYYSYFISHNVKDGQFGQHLRSRMSREKFRVWADPVDYPDFKRNFRAQVQAYDRVILVLSDAGLANYLLAEEINEVRQREVNERRKILHAVILCHWSKIFDPMIQSRYRLEAGGEIHEYLQPEDFTNWRKRDAFQAAFAKLLNRLKGK